MWGGGGGCVNLELGEGEGEGLVRGGAVSVCEGGRGW